MTQNINTLQSQLENNEWFAGIETDSFGRFIVYVSEMSVEIIKSIPEKVDNKNVLIHFYCSKGENKEDYITLEDINIFKSLSSEELKKIKAISNKEIRAALEKGKEDRDNAIRYSSSLNLSNIFFK